MPFPQAVIEGAFARSDGRCECRRQHPGRVDAPHHGGRYHGERCPITFGRQSGGFEAYHVTAESVGGINTIKNCEILCVTCHRLTQSYGRSG